jgi:hypothetical protein
MTRPTATDLLLRDAATLSAGVTELASVSTIEHFDPVGEHTVWIGPTGEWSDLDVDGRRLQSRVLEEYERFYETLHVLLRAQPADALADLKEADEEIREFLQRETTDRKTAVEAGEHVLNAIAKQADLLQRLHDVGSGTDVFVPDTNALLRNPALEEWTFDGSSRFELVLGPAILVELDELKINHRNDEVRRKAEALITRIKGYRTRGQLTAGVPLRKPASTIRTLAAEPRMSESLSWLDPANRDDQFIASTIEVIRQHPRSAVTIVTRDINLQNKAELARLPFVEPPDPSVPPIPQKPALPDVRILDIRAEGGSSGIVTFVADVQSRAPHQLRLTFSARVGDREVTCRPQLQDVVVNQMPLQLHVDVPRPELGDLVPEFGNENAMTLYGRTLTVDVVVDGGGVVSRSWDEPVYGVGSNHARHEIQQRVWRIGRGEGTEADFRGEAQADLLRRNERA